LAKSFWLPPECREGDFVVFPPEEAHHIINVLRMRSGDRVEVLCLNQRLVVELELERVLKGKILSTQEIPAPVIALDLAQSIPRGKKIEDTIKLASQVGIRRIIPFHSLRSVSRLEGEKVLSKIGRWRKIAEQESQVTGQPPLKIELPLSFEEILSLKEGYDLRLFFWENGEESLKEALNEITGPQSALLVVGPEGGFAPEEAEKARHSGFQVVSLGKRILRTEIAGIIASVILLERWGGLGE